MNSSSTVKTILFWISIVFLGVMLWKLVSANGQSAKEAEPSYSEFLTQVNEGDIKEVTMYLSPNSYELQGEYNKPPNTKFHVPIFKESAPDITKALPRQKRPTQSERSTQWRLGFDFAECGAVAAARWFLLVPDAADAGRRK